MHERGVFIVEKTIKVFNANENNLKGISTEIPKASICGICGVSGSGKSTLACEVIAKYALNAFALSMPVNLRRKISDGISPDVEEIKDIPPVILIDIKNANRSIRSTVATTSGLMTILRNMFSSCGDLGEETSLNNRLKVYPRLFSYNIPEKEGGGACSCCGGTGKAEGISAESIICNQKKSLLSGAFFVVNEKGVKFTKISDLFLRAFCDEYLIDIDKPIEKFSKEELDLVLYGSYKVICFTDRSGANGGKKELVFPGIIGALLEVYDRTKNKNIEKLIMNGTCNSCKGSRYNHTALQYKINGLSIADFLTMSIHDAMLEMSRFAEGNISEFYGFSGEFLEIAGELVEIGVGYLSLDRAIATISGGELQRIKLAKQIAMKLEEYCYVIDEPSTGLHDSNIVDLMRSIGRLKSHNNTVLLVEHNSLILNSCDYLLELGVGGGKQGGNIVAFGTPDEIKKAKTLTGEMLTKRMVPSSFDSKAGKKRLSLKGVSVNNLQNVDFAIPLNSFTTIAGVSGSGKSSAINIALHNAIKNYLDTGKKDYNLLLEDDIQDIIRLDQNATVTNSRSTVCTLLGIIDDIRLLFSKLEQCKTLGLDSGVFSKNSKLGACPSCGGAGVIIDEDENEETCGECDGTGYKKEVLQVRYKDYNIAEFMALSIDEVIEILEEGTFKNILSACSGVGLGYLSLDRKSPTLSKGEYQRIRIVNEICKSSAGKSIFILDEPSKGLHTADVKKIIDTLRNLVKYGNTVIAIEHNLDVIMQSDYVLEFGPEAGANGGKIVYSGIPSKLINMETHTAEAIRGYRSEKEKIKICKLLSTIEVKSDEKSFVIDREKINILRGYIGSGKTIIQRDLLYANPLKKYISCISTQGKYLTREINAKRNSGSALPLVRFVSEDKSYFGKNERIVESLNITHLIENIFFEYGENVENTYRSSFNAAKRAGKCISCSGYGRFMSYDFDMLFSNAEYSQDLKDLLNERTRISRIQPLLKREFGLDIAKDYHEMSDEEKQLFIFGDRKKTVYYEPKKKEYYWDGCNAILSTNMSYASDRLQQFVKPTYGKRICKYCNGLGIASCVGKACYKGISYREFNETSLKDLCSCLKKEHTECSEEKKLINVLEKLIEFGVGNIALGDYTPDLCQNVRMIVQYVSYRSNPLSDTMIVWDDFGRINDRSVKQKLLDDFERAICEGTIIVITDNNILIKNANEIIMDSIPISSDLQDGNSKRRSITFTDNVAGAIDRNEITISNRETIGGVTGVVNLIRNEFKKKYKKFKFTGVRDEEKCTKCHGTGYYEVNMGDIGYGKCVCPDCNGTGLSDLITNCILVEKNIGEVLNMPLIDLYNWILKEGNFEAAKKIEIYVKIGLEKVKISQRICDMSSNEISLYLIAVMLSSTEKEIKIMNFFNNIGKEEYEAVMTRIDRQAMLNNKRILVVKE